MTESAQSPRSIAPVLIAIIATMAFLALLAYVTQKRQSQQASVPALSLITPAPQAAVDSPLVLTFRSTQAIELTASGWGLKGLHLHAWVNDVQYMPAAADIRALNGSEYRWILPTIGRGQLTIRLGWADAQHRPLSAGSSDEISATLK